MGVGPEELRCFLEGFIREDPTWTSDVLRSLTNDKHSILETLDGILQSPSMLGGVASLSYRHLNHFDKIVLASFGKDTCKLRLHVWWGESTDGDMENIHNHRWDFSTVILHGSYRFQLYEIEPGGRGLHEYRYHSPDDSEYYSMERVGGASAECVLDARFGAGASYYLSHSCLHRVSALPQATVVTLMCQGPVRSNATRVLTEGAISNPERVSAARMSVEELRSKLERVRAILDSGSIT
jgi:hypothetical protein